VAALTATHLERASSSIDILERYRHAAAKCRAEKILQCIIGLDDDIGKIIPLP
jgi:hypothetical protein